MTAKRKTKRTIVQRRTYNSPLDAKMDLLHFDEGDAIMGCEPKMVDHDVTGEVVSTEQKVIPSSGKPCLELSIEVKGYKADIDSWEAESRRRWEVPEYRADSNKLKEFHDQGKKRS